MNKKAINNMFVHFHLSNLISAVSTRSSTSEPKIKINKPHQR